MRDSLARTAQPQRKKALGSCLPAGNAAFRCCIDINGTWFIPKNDLITPCGMNKKITSKSHHKFLVHTNKTLDHTMTLYNHTMCVWFTPSQSYSQLNMFLFIPSSFVLTPCKFCSHQQDFIHIIKFLFSHTNFRSHLANLVHTIPVRTVTHPANPLGCY